MTVDETFVDAADAADNALDAAGNAVDNAASVVPKPASLEDLPSTELAFDDIEAAANRFASTLMRNGMAGARALSETCHKQVIAEPSWSGADRCAGFDYAAAYIDERIAREAGWALNPYFQFQSDNQSDRYEAAGASAYSIHSRLTTIKKTAEQAAEIALRLEVAKIKEREAQKAREAARASPPQGTTEANQAVTESADRLD